MFRKKFPFLVLFSIIFLFSCGNNESKDITYKGKYPQIKTVSYSENGKTYEITTVANQCIVLFSDSVSQHTAKKIIKSGGGKIVEQIPAFNYYLVSVRDGKESEFLSFLNGRDDVEYTFFNTLSQFASEIYIYDDFLNLEESMLTTHGNGVRKTFSKYAVSDNIHSVDMVFLTNSDSARRYHIISNNVIMSNLLKAAKNTANEDLILINMSFGTALPGKKTEYDKYDDIDTNNQKLYVKLYANELQQLAVCFNKMKRKGISNFIVTRSSGNYRMHSMQEVFALLDNKTLNTLKDNLILVGAYDTKSDVLYSNYPTDKHSLMTTVDITKEPWSGTSFASPKLMGFIDRIHSKYENLNAQQILQAIRNATPKDPKKPMTYEMFEREAKIIASRLLGNKSYTYRLDLTSNYSGEWNLSDDNEEKIVKYEVHNTYTYDYLSGAVKAIYLYNKTDGNLNIRLKAIESEYDIRPMYYALAAGESEGFYAYKIGNMEIISVKNLEVQLSTW
ncbi:MAG: S8 family serine peptidase [Bacteroidales bacterium]|nr:S8 family serine peptidase [Bacteroidales bacterium]